MSLHNIQLVWSRYRNIPIGLLLCLGIVTPAGAGTESRVLLVPSDNNALYQSFLNTFKQGLPAQVQLKVLERAEDFSGDEQADLIVTVGMKAADSVAGKATSIPLLAAMIPSNTYATLLAKRARAQKISALYLDQPWSRQVDFLRAAFPQLDKIGMLYSADTQLNIPQLRAELAVHDFTLVAKSLSNTDKLFADMEEVFAHSEVLLAVPDSSIYSSNNIRNILLSSYRRRIPLVGLSQGYVKAGALCAIFSTPEDLATQAGSMTATFAQTRRLPEAQFPVLYSIAVNQEVARTLGITIRPPEALHHLVEKAQGGAR